MDLDKMYDTLKDCIDARPQIDWSIQNYHYEDRQVTRKDAEGNDVTET